MAKSYYASYRSKDGKTLLGGVLKSQTSRFQKKEEAEQRLETVIELSPNAEGEIIESNLYPEIFAHCEGSVSTSINSHCFKCGKLLTVEDAKAAKVY